MCFTRFSEYKTTNSVNIGNWPVFVMVMGCVFCVRQEMNTFTNFSGIVQLQRTAVVVRQIREHITDWNETERESEYVNNIILWTLTHNQNALIANLYMAEVPITSNQQSISFYVTQTLPSIYIYLFNKSTKLYPNQVSNINSEDYSKQITIKRRP
jgi:hypothetical protein